MAINTEMIRAIKNMKTDPAGLQAAASKIPTTGTVADLVNDCIMSGKQARMELSGRTTENKMREAGADEPGMLAAYWQPIWNFITVTVPNQITAWGTSINNLFTTNTTAAAEWAKVSGTITVAAAAALICLGLYKVVKWVRSPKVEEEMNVEDLNENTKMFRNKLNEGCMLTKKLFENEEKTSQSLTTASTKALDIADELAEFVEEAEEKKATEKSIVKKWAYYVLGAIVATAVIALVVYWNQVSLWLRDSWRNVRASTTSDTGKWFVGAIDSMYQYFVNLGWVKTTTEVILPPIS
ncbi:MAG: hypothetical protein GX660_17355 [Clostridiaceae bacterium]|nr:hypothetical protein [Clostridiaceae bacterium]